MRYEVSECSRCSELVENRSQIVNGVGDGSSGIVFVGEAPGAQEDQDGKPFVGRSGEILTEKLRGVGLSRDEVRITNSVRCRPPDNRDPRKAELGNCKEYLEAEIDILSPEVICTLGRVPTSNIMSERVRMGDVVGERQKVEIKEENYLVIPCYHPAAMLYDPSKEDTIDEVLETISEEARE